jgi:hypothetical protein
MTLETIQTVEVTCFDQMLRVSILGGGEPWFQTVNYALVGIEWHNNLGAFWFNMQSRGCTPDWLANVLKEVENEIDVRLQLDTATSWLNVPDDVRHEFELATN